jgi:hypothetical protein
MKVELLLAMEFNPSTSADPRHTFLNTNFAMVAKALVLLLVKRTDLAKPFVEFHGFKRKFSKHFHLPENLKMQEVEKDQEIMEL